MSDHPHVTSLVKLQKQAALNKHIDLLASKWRSMSANQKLKVFDTLSRPLQKKVMTEWRFIARPCQYDPATDEDWFLWLFTGGYGAGKTMAGSNWVVEQLKAGAKRPAIVGQTKNDVISTMIDSDGGILKACERAGIMAEHIPSKRRIIFPKLGRDVYAITYSADKPDQFKGPEHDAIWMDEQCKWTYPEAYKYLLTRARYGPSPKIFSSTTPERSEILDQQIPFMINAQIEGSEVIVYDHRVNDNPEAFIWVTQSETSDNTKLGKRELSVWNSQWGKSTNAQWALEGRILLDVPDALWTAKVIEDSRMYVPKSESAAHMTHELNLEKVVVAIDPAVTTGDNSDESGIVVCGIDTDGRGYVLEDASGKYSPVDCCRKADNLLKKWQADIVVYERNQGGDFVKETLRMVNPNMPMKDVWASKGKRTRAEPIVALYEQDRVRHVGHFDLLESQMMAFTMDNRVIKSPDRVDALVWGLTELMLGSSFDGEIIWL